MHCCLSNSKLLAMRGGSGVPAHTHRRLLEKSDSTRRQPVGFRLPKKTSLA
ncbi:unnamed protein product [Ectocarpus sp. CCAP 1310/34]|nr:unnamed protein product [Ectocarpus sp. CCAP 1310/34]